MNSFPNVYSSSGSRTVRAHLDSSGHQAVTHCESDSLPCRVHSHPHPYSDWDNADTPVHLTCTSLRCRHLDSPEQIHTDMGVLTNSTQTFLAKNILFLLIDIIIE